MKNILKTTTLALVCSMALTGCIKETFPTDSATSGQVSDSPTAVEAIVNAIPVNMTYPYSVYGRTNNYGFDFGYPGMMCATDAATGDVICSSGDEGSGYDWFTYWQSGILIGPTQTVCRFPWNCYYTFIKSSNDVVGLLAGVELSEAQKSYLGFAKAYRAQLYLDLARLYDPLNNKYTDVSGVKGLTVPIVDENTTEDMARNNPRVTREAMFEFILRDLDDAEALLANGVADVETIDAAWTLGTGAPLGPFRILDIVGLTTAYNIVVASPAAQDPESTAGRIAAVLKKHIDEGKTGINAGEGFYKYN